MYLFIVLFVSEILSFFFKGEQTQLFMHCRWPLMKIGCGCASLLLGVELISRSKKCKRKSEKSEICFSVILGSFKFSLISTVYNHSGGFFNLFLMANYFYFETTSINLGFNVPIDWSWPVTLDWIFFFFFKLNMYNIDSLYTK